MAQEEHTALVVAETAEDVMQFVAGLEAVGRAALGGHLHGFYRLGHFMPLAQEVDADVAHGDGEVGFGALHAGQAVGLLAETEEGVLHGVLGVFGVAENGKGDAVERRSETEVFFLILP